MIEFFRDFLYFFIIFFRERIFKIIKNNFFSVTYKVVIDEKQKV